MTEPEELDDTVSGDTDDTKEETEKEGTDS